MNAIPNSQKLIKDQGFVLPIALIFLLVTTLLAVSSLSSNTLSEKMARNTIQRDISFNKAESALLEAEELVRLNATAIKAAIIQNPQANNCNATFSVNGANSRGFCSPAEFPQSTTGNLPADLTDRWLINGLFDDSSNRYVTSTNGSRYIIEFVGHTLDGNNVSQCSGASASQLTDFPYCQQDALQFRITALAEGDIPGEAQVMLQSTYVASPTP